MISNENDWLTWQSPNQLLDFAIGSRAFPVRMTVGPSAGGEQLPEVPRTIVYEGRPLIEHFQQRCIDSMILFLFLGRITKDALNPAERNSRIMDHFNRLLSIDVALSPIFGLESWETEDQLEQRRREIQRLNKQRCDWFRDIVGFPWRRYCRIESGVSRLTLLLTLRASSTFYKVWNTERRDSVAGQELFDWNGGTIERIAIETAETGAGFGILADALEDAGWADEFLLRHLRGFDLCWSCIGAKERTVWKVHHDRGYRLPVIQNQGTVICETCKGVGFLLNAEPRLPESWALRPFLPLGYRHAVTR